jgi:hypothetical protein
MVITYPERGGMGSSQRAFAPKYVSGSPQVSSLNIATARGDQTVALPPHDGIVRLTWIGLGSFAYRFGTSGSTVATAGDSPAIAGSQEIIQVPSGMTHIAVYGIGSGYLTIEGGFV